MATITSSMSPGYLSVNPYLDKNSQDRWIYLEEGESRSKEPQALVQEKPEAKKSEAKKPENQPKNKKTPESVQKDIETRAQIAQLKRIEAEVIAHEMAHMAVGGRFAGSVSYSKTQGPDGRSYITGGEVPISVPASDDPEETIRNMQQVMAAALAPAKPSSQDLSVAASAASQLAGARAEASVKPEEDTKSAPKDTERIGVKEKEAKNSYSKMLSPKGLWSFGKGYETGDDPEKSSANVSEFSIAA